MQIATWNVNSLRVRLPHLLTWLERNPVDLVALQETKLQDTEFPRALLEELGWQVFFNGQKTYNGVAILARGAATEIVPAIPGFDDPQRRVLAATFGALRLINVYVPNGQSLESDKYLYKLAWLKALRDWLDQELRRYPQLIVLGDYNVAPEDRDVHDPLLWEGSVLVSEPERTALRAVMELGLHDIFRRLDPSPGAFSWWDYRAAAFRRNHGLRIDLALASTQLADRCTACQIDRDPRSWERPSDHAPMIASFDLPRLS